MLLDLLLVSMVLGASAGSTINGYLVDIRDADLISVRSTARSSDQLDLSGLGLRRIKKSAFANATNIRILSLANNSIIAPPSSVFSSLRNLEHLSLANNAIKRLNGAFVGLENLKTLNVSNNPFTVLLPGAFYGLSKTVDVFARGNSLRKIYTDVFNQDNSLGSVYPSLRISFGDDEDENNDNKDKQNDNNDEEPTSEEAVETDAKPHRSCKVCMDQGKVTLVELKRKNEVLQAGCSLVKLDDNSLSIDNLGIKAFERGWYRLANDLQISRITIRGNDIVRVTDEMLNDLPALVRTVDLSNNKIKRLEQGVIENMYINYFDLSNNSISEIEEEALAGMNLWDLNLGGNRLKDTRFLATLPPILERLYLHRNQIEEFPNEPSINMYVLKELKLSDNRITILRRNSLRGLPHLYNLDLSRNRIETLEPGCFKDTNRMRSLWLRENKIGDLDGGVFEDLLYLNYLDLGGNKLTRITQGFRDSLPSDLATLNLDRNEIGRLENGSFGDVPKDLLNLENNRITSIAKGSFVVTGLNGDDGAHEEADDSDNSVSTDIKGLQPETTPKGVGVVNLSGNPIERLENGALFGLQTGRYNYIHVTPNSIQLIPGGLFAKADR